MCVSWFYHHLPSNAGCAHMGTELRVLFFASEAHAGRITQLPHSFRERMLFANNDKIPYSSYLISHLYTHIYAYVGLFIYFCLFKACAFCIVTPPSLLWPALFRFSVENFWLSLYALISKFITLTQGWKNPRLQFTRAIKFRTVTPDIFRSSVTNLFHISHLVPYVDFWGSFCIFGTFAYLCSNLRDSPELSGAVAVPDNSYSYSISILGLMVVFFLVEILQFLGDFAESRKAPISFVTSARLPVHLSVCPSFFLYHHDYHWADAREI